MAVLRLDHFTIDPPDSEELLSRHAALVAAVKDAFPGLIGVELAKVDDRTGSMYGAGIPWPALRRRSPARRLFRRRGRRSPSPKTSPWNTPRSSMPDRARHTYSQDVAGPASQREPRRRVPRGGERA